MCATCRNAVLSGLNHDIHADIEEGDVLHAMHADAERFDPRTEEIFKVLQAISACAMSFSHGKQTAHWLQEGPRHAYWRLQPLSLQPFQFCAVAATISHLIACPVDMPQRNIYLHMLYQLSCHRLASTAKEKVQGELSE